MTSAQLHQSNNFSVNRGASAQTVECIVFNSLKAAHSHRRSTVSVIDKEQRGILNHIIYTFLWCCTIEIGTHLISIAMLL